MKTQCNNLNKFFFDSVRNLTKAIRVICGEKFKKHNTKKKKKKKST